MIRHVVLLSWNDKVTDSDVQAVTDGLAKLPSQISEIRSYQFGPDQQINKQNADYALIADFDSTEDFKTYVSHPAHVELMNNLCAPILDSYRSAQFEQPESE